MLMSGQWHALSTFTLGIRILVATGQKLNGLQSQVTQCHEDKISTLARSQTHSQSITNKMQHSTIYLFL
jgi:hypothetical protein